MTKTKCFAWIATMGFAAAAAPSLAQDKSVDTDNTVDTQNDDDAMKASDAETGEQCHARCTAKHGAAKSSKKVTRRTTQQSAPIVTPTAPAEPATFDPRTADIIRAEERARAAEEFNADTARMTETHAAEVERARIEGRNSANVENSAARDRDRATYTEAMNKKDKVIDDALLTPVGIYGFLGGGATNFTQPGAVGATSTGGYWDARVGVGSRSILGAEVAYVGSSRDIEALGLNSDAFLMGNGVEGIARLNVPITTGGVLLEPYTFGGVGWQRLNIVSSTANTSSFDSEDDIMTVPLGVGFAVGFGGLTLDLRGTYRQAIGSNLLGTQTSSFDDTSLNSWGAGGALGFEF